MKMCRQGVVVARHAEGEKGRSPDGCLSVCPGWEGIGSDGWEMFPPPCDLGLGLVQTTDTAALFFKFSEASFQSQETFSGRGKNAQNCSLSKYKCIPIQAPQSAAKPFWLHNSSTVLHRYLSLK